MNSNKENNEAILPSVSITNNYLLGIYHLSKFHDVDTYSDLFTKDVSENTQYHDLSIEEYYKIFNEEGKPDFIREVEELSQHVIESNGSRIFDKISLNIGIICDEFLYSAYKDAANLHYINYNKDGINQNFDFVIIATTWSGIDKSWQNVSKENSEERHHLYELIDELKERGIPTVFYSKEDPVNYDQFIGIAKQCNFVFTSAEEIIPRYKKAVGHDKVYKLEFAINPHVHNPLGINKEVFKDKQDDIIFAGSWMVKYPVRNKETAMAFDGVIKSNKPLTIIDRNLNLENKRYHFPTKYIPYLSYPLPHAMLMKSHKIFKTAINVNSVKYSNTMFANRIYELQAFGNILVSNFSMGVNTKFPHIFIFNHNTDVPQFLKYTDTKTLREISAAGIRQTMNNETTYHRIQYIAEKLDINIEVDDAKVLIILDKDTDEAVQMAKSQSYQNHDYVSFENVHSEMLGNYRFITFFNTERYFYEEYYIEELISGFKYADIDFVSKNGELETYNFTDTFKTLAYSMVDLEAIRDSLSNPFENIHLSNGLNIDNTELIKHDVTDKEDLVVEVNKKRLSVVIPVHNNGRYLEHKCLKSLKRLSVYNELEIILVNDGSTTKETKDILRRLLRRNPDFKYYAFDTASGSASTPRNKGVLLATTDYITFLDPDNEATGDGFSLLLQEIEADPSLDMVVGNMVKEDQNEKSIFNYHKIVHNYNFKEPIIEDTYEFLKRSQLTAQSIQAMIIKKDIIINNNIKMVEGAIGQDTIYYQELLIHSNRVKSVNEVIHMYYGAVQDSVTNAVGTSFFEKYLKLEKYRISFLEKHNLLDTYIEERFEYYMSNWYLPRLKRAKKQERKRSAKVLLDIFYLYKPYVGESYSVLEELITSES